LTRPNFKLPLGAGIAGECEKQRVHTTPQCPCRFRRICVPEGTNVALHIHRQCWRREV